jgi:hypothetical protein
MGTCEHDALWDALADLGLPISAAGPPRAAPRPDEIPRLVREALKVLEAEEDTAAAARKRECLAAFLLAVATSYPTRYAAWFEGADAVARIAAQPPTGRILKLKRIAERRLSELL